MKAETRQSNARNTSLLPRTYARDPTFKSPVASGGTVARHRGTASHAVPKTVFERGRQAVDLTAPTQRF